MIKNASWICSKEDYGDAYPIFCKGILIEKEIIEAKIEITATGVYEVYINGERVGDYVLAPGWTKYDKRLQYQSYDVTDMFRIGNNVIEVQLGAGWYNSRLMADDKKRVISPRTPCMIADIMISDSDGEKHIYSDITWKVKEGKVRFSDIYDGEIYDANFEGEEINATKCYGNKSMLIPQEGEKITEQDRICPIQEFITPKGERVIDFGQELTGYVETRLCAKKGEILSLSFAEMLDKEGNFYNENYRTAKCIHRYICKEGTQTYKPRTTFYGFRYIRVDEAPKGLTKDDFTAIVVCSDIKKTGTLKTKNKLVDRLFRNIEWGQRGNFLDIPTDCPQRDERLGWTADAQVFIKTATYQYDVKRFFTKWLNDMMYEQRDDGLVNQVVPRQYDHSIHGCNTIPGWGDATVICPWTIYETYGDTELLRKHYPMMKKWISYIESVTDEEYLWIGFPARLGDWLGLDYHDGYSGTAYHSNNYSGSTDCDYIASAYYVYDLSLIIKAAKVLDSPELSVYEQKYEKARRKFMARFQNPRTQTEHALAIHFNLSDKKEELAKNLADLIHKNGDTLTTGFIGTPYLLYALSNYGQKEMAYTLLLQDKFPSWLFSVRMGGTTVWEHWDGINEKGEFWSKDMNSFNHYAYGSVAAWVYSYAAGILINENGLEVAPHPDKRLGDLNGEFVSRYGKVVSNWKYEDDKIKFHIEIPVTCNITINGETKSYQKGSYDFCVPTK